MVGQGKGDAGLGGRGNEKPDERQQAETSAREALLKDLPRTAGGQAAADQIVKNFEKQDALHHTPEQVTQDLTRLAQKFEQLFKPGENGQGSVFDRMKAHDPELARTLSQGMKDTFDLANKVAASFESGKIQPGQDTPKAVEKLMERLSHQKT